MTKDRLTTRGDNSARRRQVIVVGCSPTSRRFAPREASPRCAGPSGLDVGSAPGRLERLSPAGHSTGRTGKLDKSRAELIFIPTPKSGATARRNRT